jgi:phospholipid/cholesterol/gamma-HCH transport system substrate-binding protein
MGRTAARDFLVGCFVLAGIIAIGYLSLRLGGLANGPRGGFTVYASFDELGGLKPRAAVVVSGVKVGQVRSIALDKSYRARVELDIDPTIKLPVDTTASIMTSGLLGDRYIELQLGGDTQLVKNGEDIGFTESAVVLERLIGKFIHNVGVDKGEKSDKKEESP